MNSQQLAGNVIGSRFYLYYMTETNLDLRAL